MRYSPGSQPTFYASFTDENLVLVTPDSVYVDIFNAEQTKVVNNGVPVEDSTGNFHFDDYEIPMNAPTGLWKIEWQAVVDERNAFGFEEFEVELAGVVVSPSDQTLHGPLRSRIGEISRLDADQNGSDTLFPTAEIAEILSLTSNNLDRATLEAWERKAGKLSSMIDIMESGSQRNLSRRFIQAKQMVDHWTRVLTAASVLRSTALAGRVGGLALNLRDPIPAAPVRTGFSAMYERQYVTHRLLIPAILQ